MNRLYSKEVTPITTIVLMDIVFTNCKAWIINNIKVINRMFLTQGLVTWIKTNYLHIT